MVHCLQPLLTLWVLINLVALKLALNGPFANAATAWLQRQCKVCFIYVVYLQQLAIADPFTLRQLQTNLRQMERDLSLP